MNVNMRMRKSLSLSLLQNCSFSICYDDEMENNLEVAHFAFEWRAKKGACIFNPSNHRQVIAQRGYSLPYVLHTVLWPGLFIILTLIYFVYYFLSGHCGKCCGDQGHDIDEVSDLKQPLALSDPEVSPLSLPQATRGPGNAKRITWYQNL